MHAAASVSHPEPDTTLAKVHDQGGAGTDTRTKHYVTDFYIPECKFQHVIFSRGKAGVWWQGLKYLFF